MMRSSKKIENSKYIEEFDGFVINGMGTRERLGVQTYYDYLPSHKYAFLEQMGETPQQVTFQIVNENISSTDAVFVVEISDRNLVYVGGR